MKTKLASLDKSRPYGEIRGEHPACYEQDGMLFDSEGQSITDGPKAPVKAAPPAPAPKAPEPEKPAETATVIDEPTIGVDLKSYAFGTSKAPWHMVVKAVTDAYGVTPANKEEAVKIIRAGHTCK